MTEPVGDPFRKVIPGEPLAISAVAWNAMIDNAKSDQRRSATSQPLTRVRDADIIKVLNDTGQDLPQYSVVGLDGPIFDPSINFASLAAFLREVAFIASLPTTAGQFGITLDPIRIGGVGRAYVAGVCPVQINLQKITDTCADIQAGSIQ